jgi:adenosylcobinamide-GDP ribazoletransferase
VVKDLKIALVFLTRLPLRLGGPVGLRDLASAVHFFPVVGALVGLLAAIGYVLLLEMDVPALAAAAIALGIGMVVTGALHEDGLADTADGLGSDDPERGLEIMRDSRIGSFGTIAIALSLLCRAAALAALLEPERVAPAMIAAAALSRAFMPVVILTQPSARASGLAADTGRPESNQVWIGLGIAALIGFLLLPTGAWLMASLVAAGVAATVALWLGRHFGGCTGDTLGAVQQAGEVAFLLALAAQLR